MVKDRRQARDEVLQVRLEEHPLPAGTRDPHVLTDWLLRSLGLVRRRSGDVGDQPLHRLFLEHLLPDPRRAHESAVLADELGISVAGLHHHLQRLSACGLLVNGEAGRAARRWHVRWMDLGHAVGLMANAAQSVARLRLAELGQWWGEAGQRGEPPEPPEPLVVRIAEPHPGEEDQAGLGAWMGAFGLLGDRPGAASGGPSLPEAVFARLLKHVEPLSLDEGERVFGATRGQVLRALERLERAGLVSKRPRLDRLPAALWAAMQGQHVRRGGEWMTRRGGLGLLDDEVAQTILSTLAEGSLKPGTLKSMLTEVAPDMQVLLLNRLGGRLAWGHQLVADDASGVAHHVLGRIERVLGRLRRAAVTLAEVAEVAAKDVA